MLRPVLQTSFFKTILIATAAVFASCLVANAGGPGGAAPSIEPIMIEVAAPAGAAPLGATVEASIPWAQGQVTNLDTMTVLAPDGQPVISQWQATANWPDGSIRWAHVLFDPARGPGAYRIEAASKRGQEPELLKELDGRVTLETGEVTVLFAKAGGRWTWQLQRGGVTVIGAKESPDLVMTTPDGKTYRSALDKGAQLVIEERGPVRASVRLEGTVFADDGSKLFDYLLRIAACRGRPEVHVRLTWINGTDRPSEQVRDIRLVLPHAVNANRLVIGCEHGVYDEAFVADWPVYILQRDHDQYWVRTRNPDKQFGWLDLANGGCNGKRFPGWLYLQSDQHTLGIYVPNFWQTYPNEIEVFGDRLAVGLWPERATDYLLHSLPILPNAPFGWKPYFREAYWPVMPHPYRWGLSPGKQSLDAVQGMASTQDVVLSVWDGKGKSPTFEAKAWKASLRPVRGSVDPRQLTRSGAMGRIWPYDPSHFPKHEEMYNLAYGWLQRHAEVMKAYGKFDYGDFHYLTASTTMTSGPTGLRQKGSDEHGAMARQGYWNNNEQDPFRGILLHYLRTGDPQAWDLVEAVARHLFDIDISHHDHWGMYTHTYGHCYLISGQGKGDHSWLVGMMEWAAVTGDPIQRKWVMRCVDDLVPQTQAVLEKDARNASVLAHVMANAYAYTGDQKYLRAAKQVVDKFILTQQDNGRFLYSFAANKDVNVGTFQGHVLLALADYYTVTKDVKVLQALKKATHYDFPESKGKRWRDTTDIGYPMIFQSLALLWEQTHDPQYVDMAKNLYQTLISRQNQSSSPYARGEYWAKWGVNKPELCQGSPRPEQFMSQTRVITISSLMAFSRAGQWLLAQDQKLPLPEPTPPVSRPATAP